MTTSILCALTLILLTPFVVSALHGAPYVPTLSSQISEIFEISGAKSGQLLIDLGSGDGRILRAAAHHGLRAVGYEINPVAWLMSLFTIRKERDMVDVKLGNFWHERFTDADIIYAFLSEKHMIRLDQTLQMLATKQIIVISNTFSIPGRRVIRQLPYAHVYIYGQA